MYFSFYSYIGLFCDWRPSCPFPSFLDFLAKIECIFIKADAGSISIYAADVEKVHKYCQRYSESEKKAVSIFLFFRCVAT